MDARGSWMGGNSAALAAALGVSPAAFAANSYGDGDDAAALPASSPPGTVGSSDSSSSAGSGGSRTLQNPAEEEEDYSTRSSSGGGWGMSTVAEGTTAGGGSASLESDFETLTWAARAIMQSKESSSSPMSSSGEHKSSHRLSIGGGTGKKKDEDKQKRREERRRRKKLKKQEERRRDHEQQSKRSSPSRRSTGQSAAEASSERSSAGDWTGEWTGEWKSFVADGDVGAHAKKGGGGSGTATSSKSKRRTKKTDAAASGNKGGAPRDAAAFERLLLWSELSWAPAPQAAGPSGNGDGRDGGGDGANEPSLCRAADSSPAEPSLRAAAPVVAAAAAKRFLPRDPGHTQATRAVNASFGTVSSSRRRGMSLAKDFDTLNGDDDAEGGETDYYNESTTDDSDFEKMFSQGREDIFGHGGARRGARAGAGTQAETASSSGRDGSPAPGHRPFRDDDDRGNGRRREGARRPVPALANSIVGSSPASSLSQDLRADDDVDRLVDLGNESFASGDYLEAKVLYLRALGVQNDAIERRRSARRRASRRMSREGVATDRFDDDDDTREESEGSRALSARRRRTACVVHKRLGDSYRELDRIDKAHGHYQLALHQAFAPSAPSSSSAAQDAPGRKKKDRQQQRPRPDEQEILVAAKIVVDLGDLYADAGLYDRALCRYNEALRLSDGLPAENGRRELSATLAARRAFRAHEALAAEALESSPRKLDAVFFHYREMTFLSPYLPPYFDEDGGGGGCEDDGGSSGECSSLGSGMRSGMSRSRVLPIGAPLRALLNHGGGGGGPSPLHARRRLGLNRSSSLDGGGSGTVSFLAEAKKSLKAAGQVGTKEEVASLMDDMAAELVGRSRTEDAVRCHEEKLDLLRRCATRRPSDNGAIVDVLVDLGHLCTSVRRHGRAASYFAAGLQACHRRQYLDEERRELEQHEANHNSSTDFTNGSKTRMRRRASATGGKFARRRSSLNRSSPLTLSSSSPARPPVALEAVAGWLAASHIYAGNAAAAVRHCEEYLLMCPPDRRAGVLCSTGLLHAASYRFAKALWCYGRAMDLLASQAQQDDSGGGGGGGGHRGDEERRALVRGLRDAFPHGGVAASSSRRHRPLRRRRRTSGDGGRFEAAEDAADGRTVLLHLGLVQLRKLPGVEEALSPSSSPLSSSPRPSDGLKRRERNDPGADIVAAALEAGRRAKGGSSSSARGNGVRDGETDSDTDSSDSCDDDDQEEATAAALEHFHVLRSMGNILLRRGRHSEAVQYFERCIAELTSPSSAEWVVLSRFVVPRQERFRLHADAGVCYLEMWGENDLSLSHFDSALAELEKCRVGSDRKRAARRASVAGTTVEDPSVPRPWSSVPDGQQRPSRRSSSPMSQQSRSSAADAPFATLMEQLSVLSALGAGSGDGTPPRYRDAGMARRARHLAALALRGMGLTDDASRVLEVLVNDGTQDEFENAGGGLDESSPPRTWPDVAEACVDLAVAARAAGSGDPLNDDDVAERVLSREESLRLFVEGADRLLAEEDGGEERLSPDHPLFGQVGRMREFFFADADDDEGREYYEASCTKSLSSGRSRREDGDDAAELESHFTF